MFVISTVYGCFSCNTCLDVFSFPFHYNHCENYIIAQHARELILAFLIDITIKWNKYNAAKTTKLD